MNTVEMDYDNRCALSRETVLHFPLGLLGFEDIKKYLLVPAAEEPFFWMKAENEPSLSFLVVSPFEILPTYAPDIPAEEVRALGIECPDDVELLSIITLRQNGKSTMNLKGPIVMNRFSRIARQVIIANAPRYSVEHLLLTPDSE